MQATAIAEIQQTAPFVLPPLPYPDNSLEPFISQATVQTHHGKHHLTYVNKASSLVKDSPFEKMMLTDIIRTVRNKPEKSVLFNNAGQAWNHWFYWNSMTPGGGGEPSGELREKLERSFGSLDAFRKEFSESAAANFGSGWTWLIADGDTLRVMNTSNADTPIAHDRIPLITLDVWEHAYYLDYRNKRADYIQAWLDHLVNWEFAQENLSHRY